MDALKSLVSPLVGGAASSGVVDGMKLVVLGGTVETARRISSSAWTSFVNSFFLTAHFSEEDYPYDWLMLWLSKRPEWQRAREFETTTRTISPGMSSSFGDNSFGDEELEDVEPVSPDDQTPGMAKTRVIFQPTFDSTHTIFYRGHWLRVRRSRKPDGSDVEVLSISVVARNNNVLKQLVLQAKREYEAESVHRIQIYFADSHGSWRWTDSRHKRPMGSIVLEPGVKEMLLADTRDFLRSEKWYADRGIPFRRGYLLHGVPGSGKSSLIHALAGALMLDIYVISLSASWMNDATLSSLMGRVPARCIVLLEDLDAAFTRSTSRDGSSTGVPGGKKKSSSSSDNKDKDDDDDDDEEEENGKKKKSKKDDSLSDVNTLSLSGLLNALDGVAAAEGRILFATTNHLERLDPALSRPGRMDVWIEFKNASPWQAEALFRNFFPCADADEAEITEREGELDGINLPGTPASSASSGSISDISVSAFASDASSATSVRSSSSSRRASSAAGKKPAEGFGSQNTAYMPPPPDPEVANASHSAKPLDSATLTRLAKQFADAIPKHEFSVAALQGYLLKNKSRPEAAAEGAAAWVISERELRERLAREREARELKEKQEREQRRKEVREKKLKEEREKLEKEEKERKEREQKEREERAQKEKEEREQKAREERERSEKEAKEKAESEKVITSPATTVISTTAGDDADDEESESSSEADEANSGSWVKADTTSATD